MTLADADADLGDFEVKGIDGSSQEFGPLREELQCCPHRWVAGNQSSRDFDQR